VKRRSASAVLQPCRAVSVYASSGKWVVCTAGYWLLAVIKTPYAVLEGVSAGLGSWRRSPCPAARRRRPAARGRGGSRLALHGLERGSELSL